jgi:hypothetical protein
MASKRSSWLRKRFALPSEHGVWIWWLGPLVVGLAAGGRPRLDFALLVLAAFAAFLLHQPSTIAVKAASGRRDRKDLAPALAWAAAYAVLALLFVGLLVRAGHAEVLWLAVPGLPVFLWHLALVARREERRRVAVEVLAAGALALAAPAAYRVAGGTDAFTEWSLWGWTWLQSAAAILNVYRALDERTRPRGAPPAERLRRARLGLAVPLGGFALACVLAVTTPTPPGVAVAFLLVLAHAAWSVLRGGAGLRPATIGVRQLGAGLLFVLAMCLAYNA